MAAAAASPHFVETQLDLGVLYQRAGMRRLALESYRRALALSPDHPELARLRDALERRAEGTER